MKQTIVGFGDSWTFGSELDRPAEQCWLTQLATAMDADYCNMSTPASSIGHLTVQLFDFIQQNPNFENNKLIFMVGLTGLTRYLSYSNRLNEFINITPEANYQSSNIHQSGRPPDVVKEFRTLSGEMYRMVECITMNF